MARSTTIADLTAADRKMLADLVAHPEGLMQSYHRPQPGKRRSVERLKALGFALQSERRSESGARLIFITVTEAGRAYQG